MFKKPTVFQINSVALQNKQYKTPGNFVNDQTKFSNKCIALMPVLVPLMNSQGCVLQLTTKSMSSSSQVELENRLHSLTESLIQKQTMLEALSTEKNSLVLQLERLEVGHDISGETRGRTQH